jgi:hypothetical protein
VNESPLTAALKQFEAAEANLTKLEKLWDEIAALIPSGIVFGGNVEYDDRRRSFESIIANLPAIDGWKPTNAPIDLDDIAQWRLDAKDCGEITAEVAVEKEIEVPGRELREYRFKFNQKRRELIRDALVKLIDQIDAGLREAKSAVKGLNANDKIAHPVWTSFRNHVDEIDALLGSSVQRPAGWTDLRRHIHFGMVCDLMDIEKSDWPAVKKELRQGLYGAHEPVPVDVKDLSMLVEARPTGPVTTKLKWTALTAEGFERLMFSLISGEDNYENPEWLMKTNAPDKGRDLSVTRITKDPLSGTTRSRVVIQCRHRPKEGVSVSDITTLREQMKLWGDPPVNVLIVATTGRFTADAVGVTEKHNLSDRSLRIEMWPDSHLERLLASRPALIAEFGLR